MSLSSFDITALWKTMKLYKVSAELDVRTFTRFNLLGGGGFNFWERF